MRHCQQYATLLSTSHRCDQYVLLRVPYLLGSTDLCVKIYLEQGLMERLRELLPLGDPALKLGALWAVKNLLRKSTTETKRSVMRQLGWDRVVEYVGFSKYVICAYDIY